ncbi:protease modulator HflC [Ectothiorhodospira lacustris]|uniref:protease modulator HflC n=1 Tax=Ectothiorhodospira lacustris TaxID=2899127 RepID=UPI001EE8667E|nr:protease modulator HflC [Ectothiorhodospira lacustris]MCG5500163.1 protease modulator HflC [Ectothiorhodospira lacustris]MCG5510915.1 protease modulator HflC [Ectothiorhodospira lacustris]MCG5522647.1 protease modulator HflC [Ectothiorhodospira lacustris]
MFRIAAIGLAVAALVVWLSTFTVDERERVIVFSLGEIKRTDLDPGLHFKFPIVNNVRKFDARIMTLDIPPDRFLTSEAKNVIVDFYAKWRIDDVGQFFRATRGDERNAQDRMAQILRDGMRNEFAKYTLDQVVSGDRITIMGAVRQQALDTASELGVSLVDVRIRRMDLPDEVSESVFSRMRAERERIAQDFRARGQEQSERIRADADRQRTVIIANAYREAEQIRGEGDATSAAVYAQAYGQDAEFFSFYRSLLAYRNTMVGKDNFYVLEPDSEFFRYFQDPMGMRSTREN